jgi:putative transcriptional regulator
VRRFLAFALALLAAAAAAQERPNAALLIAKPELEDANFSRTVLLVTQTESGETVGVILNRPTGRKHPRTREVLYFGGPVMREVQIAVFRSADAPRAPAFHVLRDVYLSMHPRNIDALLSGDARNHRLYSGFAGWAPGQLEAEMERDSWYVLPASEALLFRDSTEGMWEELLEKARGGRTAAAPRMARLDQRARSQALRADRRIIPQPVMSKSSAARSPRESKSVY